MQSPDETLPPAPLRREVDSFIDLASEGMGLVCCDELRVVEANPALLRILGAARDRPLRLAERFLDPEDVEGLCSFVSSGERNHVLVAPLRGEGGREVTAELRFAKEGSYFRLFVRDRTVELQAEADWLRLRRLRSFYELAEGAIHDLNNSLGGILGYSEHLASRLAGEEDQAYLRRLSEATGKSVRLVALFHDMVRVARARRETVELADLVRDVVQLFGKTALRSGIEVDCRVPPRLAAVRVQPLEIRHALVRLLLFVKENGATTLVVEGGEETSSPGDPHLPPRRYGVVRVLSTGDAERAAVTGRALARPSGGLEAFQGLGEHGQGLLAAALATRLSGGDLRYEGAAGGMLRHKLLVPAAIGPPPAGA
jgi:PAS domain-containing protein